MSIIAAFLWTKSPRCSISTLIFDDEMVDIFVSPKIEYLPKGHFAFNKAVKTIVKEFFAKIEHLHNINKNPVVIEFKIVFHPYDIPYMLPARESKFVYNTFVKASYKIKKKYKNIKLKPQLRKKLSGKSLKLFKKKLRSLYLVSRKRNTNFEYHLWALALHATNASYSVKLERLHKKLASVIVFKRTILV